MRTPLTPNAGELMARPAMCPCMQRPDGHPIACMNRSGESRLHFILQPSVRVALDLDLRCVAVQELVLRGAFLGYGVLVGVSCTYLVLCKRDGTRSGIRGMVRPHAILFVRLGYKTGLLGCKSFITGIIGDAAHLERV